MATHIDFTKGKILSPLLRFAMPVLLALFLQALYGAVDLLIVGKYAATQDISAVATGTQVMFSITGVLVGLSTGITVLVGQKIGEGKPEVAGNVIGSGIALFGIITVVATALFVGCANPISALMQAPKTAFYQTVDYVRICSAGTVFIIGYNVLGSIFRGIGDSKMPLITVSIACVVNIFGDLLLVKVFSLGAAGAAIATVFAQAVSVFLSLIIIKFRKLPFVFTKECISFNKLHIGRILKIGTPIALQDLLVSFSFLVIMAIINSIGVNQSAGVGVAEKLCAFILLIPSAFSQSMSSFVAQNTGAEKPERSNKALWYGICVSVCAGFLLGYLAFFHGDLLSSVFANDKTVIGYSSSYLKAYAFDAVLTSFLFCFIGYFCGRGNTTFVMLQGLIGAFCVRIPISYFVSRIEGIELFYIGLATPISTVVQIIICLTYYFVMTNRDKKGE